MKKRLIVPLFLFLLTLTLTLILNQSPTAHAALSTVYLSSSGSDSGDGTQNAPYLTMGKAMDAVSDGGVEKTYRNENSKKRYVAVHDEDSGTWTFNRFYIGMQSITADVSSGNVGYKAAVGGNANVKNALNNKAFGFKVWVEGWEDFAKNPTLTRNDFVTGETGTTMYLRIANQLKYINGLYVDGKKDEAAAAQSLDVKAQVTICFADSEPVESATYAFSIVQMYQALDAEFDGFTAAQKTGMAKLIETFPVMKTWNLTNTVAFANQTEE